MEFNQGATFSHSAFKHNGFISLRYVHIGLKLQASRSVCNYVMISMNTDCLLIVFFIENSLSKLSLRFLIATRYIILSLTTLLLFFLLFGIFFSVMS